MMHKIKWSSVLSALSALAGNIAHADDAWLKASGLGPMQYKTRLVCN